MAHPHECRRRSGACRIISRVARVALAMCIGGSLVAATAHAGVDRVSARAATTKFPHAYSASPAFGGGCNNNASGGETFTPAERGDFAKTVEGDVIPSNFISNRVVDAWNRGATGAGVTIAAIDTGIYAEQPQLSDIGFAPFGTRSADRTIERLDVGAGTVDVCNHGTRSAGTAAAPWDGANTVGVAWKANLVSVKIGNAVVLNGSRAARMASALRQVVEGRARLLPGAEGEQGDQRLVVSMGVGDYPLFGITGSYRRLENTIRDLNSRYDVLFVGAAGSSVCPVDNQIAFPARMREVLAVTAAKNSRTVHRTACGGPDVDLGVSIHDRCGPLRLGLATAPCMAVPAPGRAVEDLVQFSASSDATAVMSGIAALVWSQHPDWTRDQVRRRLLESGSLWPVNDLDLGKGIVDAWKATGGLAGVRIAVSPQQVMAGRTYTARAAMRGDGPFSYEWSTGETTPTVRLTAGGPGSRQTVQVRVTDVTDGSTQTATRTISVPRSADGDEGGEISLCTRQPWKCRDQPR